MCELIRLKKSHLPTYLPTTHKLSFMYVLKFDDSIIDSFGRSYDREDLTDL